MIYLTVDKTPNTYSCSSTRPLNLAYSSALYDMREPKVASLYPISSYLLANSYYLEARVELSRSAIPENLAASV